VQCDVWCVQCDVCSGVCAVRSELKGAAHFSCSTLGNRYQHSDYGALNSQGVVLIRVRREELGFVGQEWGRNGGGREGGFWN
jgi:hypothetical protein